MNIGLFTDCYFPTPNGVAASVEVLKNGLEKRGHRISVFAPAFPGRGREEQSLVSIPSLRALPSVGVRWALPDIDALERIVTGKAIEVIHTHSEFPVARAARRIAAQARIPLVHTAHTMYEHYRHYVPLGFFLPTRAIRSFWRAFLRPYSAVVCPSPKSAAYFSAVLPSLARDEIPNGVELSRFREHSIEPEEIESFRRGLGLPEDSRVLLYIGRIAPEKRTDALVDACIPIVESIPDIRLLLIGGGPGLESTRRRVKKLGLSRRVLLPGYLAPDRVPVACAAATLFMTASLSENHPMTIIEAAASGLPIVARKDGSLAGVVSDGLSGLLAATDSELTASLERMLSSATCLESFAARGRELARAFSSDTHAQALERTYERVIAENRNSAASG